MILHFAEILPLRFDAQTDFFAAKSGRLLSVPSVVHVDGRPTTYAADQNMLPIKAETRKAIGKDAGERFT